MLTARCSASDAVQFLLGFGGVFGLAAAGGGFFATDWGWPAMVLLLVAAGALVVRDGLCLDSLQVAMLVLLAGVVVWIAVSSLWSPTATLPLLEAERAILYLAAAAAVSLTSGRASARPLAAGVLLACVGVAGWALHGRLFPQAVPAAGGLGAYRLTGPLGYWNGLGLLVVVGLLLAVGFALHEPTRVGRAAAAAATVVLLPTLVFTFSRGSWFALGMGAAALVALEPERLRMLPRMVLVVPGAAVAALLAAGSPALTRPGSTVADASREGHRLALGLLLLAAIAALLSVLADRLPPARIGRRARRGLLVAAIVTVATIGAAVVVDAGGPRAFADRGAAAFASDTAGAGNLNDRLLSGSGSGRGDYWRTAWEETRAHALLGGGAGSFGRWWLRSRPNAFGALDAHELYLETLAELGPPGLVLLAGALAMPVIALTRRRRAPLTAACAAAYVAFLVHAALDWDWELTAVGVAGLLCGTAVLVSVQRPTVRVGPWWRALGVALALPLIGFVVVLHVGNAALSTSRSALDRNDPAAALRAARRAQTWQPWSTQPLLAVGEAQLSEGDGAAAAASFRTAARRDPGDWEPWYQLALATSGPERARALARAVRLNPRSPEIAALQR